MCSKTTIKIILITFNFLFWAAGSVVLGFGIWTKTDPAAAIEFVHMIQVQSTDPLVTHAASLFIAVGALAFFVGFLGLCGAYNEKKPMLILYACLLVVFMIIEISAVVILVIYQKKVEVSEQKKQMKQTFLPRNHSDEVKREIWDRVQEGFKCCGVSGFSDYLSDSSDQMSENDSVPETCCVKSQGSSMGEKYENLPQCRSDAQNNIRDSPFLHKEGCFDAVIDWARRQVWIMVTLAVGILAFELIGSTSACFLCLLLSRTSSKAD